MAVGAYRNFRGFGRRCRSLAVQTDAGVNRIVKDVAISVHFAVAQGTPVDKGRARSNWIVRLNRPQRISIRPWAPGSRLGRGERSNLAAAVAQAVGVIELRDKREDIHITNNLPYIQRLNDGYSDQSPSGFVQAGIRSGVRDAMAFNRKFFK